MDEPKELNRYEHYEYDRKTGTRQLVDGLRSSAHYIVRRATLNCHITGHVNRKKGEACPVCGNKRTRPTTRLKSRRGRRR